MSAGLWHLERKKERLKKEITEQLDFLEGSVTTQGPNRGYTLTRKERGKTTSRYIRVGTLKEVKRMTRKHKQLKALLKELGDVNWEILKLNHPV